MSNLEEARAQLEALPGVHRALFSGTTLPVPIVNITLHCGYVDCSPQERREIIEEIEEIREHLRQSLGCILSMEYVSYD